MKSEFALAFNEIAEHSKLKREVILEALENAMVTAYRKAVNASAAQHVVVKVDPATGAVRVFAEKEVVDEVQEFNTEVALADARLVDPDAQLGDMVTVESTPRNFGRIAAQAAKQNLMQKLRDAEREIIYNEFKDRKEEIVSGIVTRFERKNLIVQLRPNVDAVLIASPDATHKALTLACIEARKPVLCEKPLAPTAAECREDIGRRRELQLVADRERRFEALLGAVQHEPALRLHGTSL